VAVFVSLKPIIRKPTKSDEFRSDALESSVVFRSDALKSRSGVFT
jgi:hypothetical protein